MYLSIINHCSVRNIIRTMCRVVFLMCMFYIVAADKLPDGVQFRKDYEYNKETDAYYKIHIDNERWSRASQLCKGEGGTLMLSDKEDVIFAHSRYKLNRAIDDKLWIKTKEERVEDTNNDYEHIYETYANDDCPAMNREGDIEEIDCTLDLPFICKISKNEIYYNTQCDVFSKDYIYNNVTGSCYKYSTIPQPWFEAETECLNENSHLLVINSKVEGREISSLMSRFPTYTVGSYHSHYVIIGFRVRINEKEQRIFRTVFNDTLQDAGFNEWSATEPNNFANSEYCGSVFRDDGKLNDVNCAKPYTFICEKEIARENLKK